ncbi:MAG: hypothetical protein ACOYVJ_12095 [Nitrospirota bacterium]
MRYNKEHTSGDRAGTPGRADPGQDIRNDLSEGRPRSEANNLLFVSDIVSGISHGLKSASDYRMRLQREIQDILKRQAFARASGASSAESKEMVKEDEYP